MNFVFISAFLAAAMRSYVQDLGFVEELMVETERFLILGEGRRDGGRHDDGGNLIWMVGRFQMTRGDDSQLL
jgi:hypothetical protein